MPCGATAHVPAGVVLSRVMSGENIGQAAVNYASVNSIVPLTMPETIYGQAV